MATSIESVLAAVASASQAQAQGASDANMESLQSPLEVLNSSSPVLDATAASQMSQSAVAAVAFGADDQSKREQWTQVFQLMQQFSLSDRAYGYAQVVGKLRLRSQELLRAYLKALASEEQLLQNAYEEALHAQAKLQQEQELLGAYQEAVQVQVRARQEVEAAASQLQRELQAAHQAGVAAQGLAKKGAGGRFPRRLGTPPCQYYMRTGECHYGVTCKWDHPERKTVPPLLKPGPIKIPGIQPAIQAALQAQGVQI